MGHGDGSVSLVARVAKGVAFLLVTTFFVLLGAGGSLYLWQAHRLQLNWQAELDQARAQGRLTEDQYRAELPERSFEKALMSPSQVWEKMTEKGLLRVSR